ncbi:MAG: SDR family oxidoreductase [Chloroflexi bacterium]|nr:SDR family oxidoreductase [Chloroflexota bacterium]
MRLVERVAVVTGGGNGMGREYCRALAGAGATVVVAEIDDDAATSVARSVGGAALHLDITDEASVAAGVRDILERHGRIDILVNNAGGALGRRALLGETDLETWEATLRLNLTGPFLMSREVIPHMRARGYGKIVNVCSASVFSGIAASLYLEPPARQNLVPYLAAKGGVLGLTRALAREVGVDGIRVNAVAPGYTLTERARRTLSAEVPADVLSRQVFPRAGAPEDPAGAVLFLASPDSDWMTGQTLVVDGGWVAH